MFVLLIFISVDLFLIKSMLDPLLVVRMVIIVIEKPTSIPIRLMALSLKRVVTLDVAPKYKLRKITMPISKGKTHSKWKILLEIVLK